MCDYTDACIDIETLGTDDDAIILSCGLILFNRFDTPETEGKTHKVVLDVDSQVAAGRTVSLDTLNFWRKQSDAAWEAATAEPSLEPKIDNVGLRSDLQLLFRRFDGKVWARDPSFDVVILKSYLKEVGGLPRGLAKFHNWRSFRTLKDISEMLGCDKEDKSLNPMEHDALSDAVYESQMIRKYYQYLSAFTP